MQSSVVVGEKTFQLTFDDTYGTRIGPVFEPGLVRLLTALTPRDAQAVDVGANIGLTTLALSQLATQVHAFEVVPGTFALLSANVGGLPNVVLHDVGLGCTAGPVALIRVVDDRSGAYISDEPPTAGCRSEVGRIEVLDAVNLGTERVGVMKIDVEGFEIPVLLGAQKLLARDRPVVVLEMNHWCLNAFRRRSVPDFLDDLRALFPVLRAVDDLTGESLDLRDPDEAHLVMHEHIVGGRFKTVIGAFEPAQVEALSSLAADEVPVTDEPAQPDEERSALLARCQALEAELDAMRRTVSWRVTRPLRALRRASLKPARRR